MPTSIRSIDDTQLTDLISWLAYATGHKTIMWGSSFFNDVFSVSTPDTSVAIGPKVQGTCRLRVYDGKGHDTQIDVPSKLMPALCELYDMAEATAAPTAVVKTVQTTLEYLKGLQPR